MSASEKRLRDLATLIEDQGEALWIVPILLEIAEEVREELRNSYAEATDEG